MVHGGYSSEDEVLRDALRALEAVSYVRPDPHAGQIPSVEALRREVCRGIDALDRSEGRDADEVFDELLRDLPSEDQG
jgi:hypothetical protein